MGPASWLADPPRPRDILLCYFPYQEDHGRPALVEHPCLVLSIGKKPDGSVVLFVAYGSSKGIPTTDPTNVVVSPKTFAGTGLTKPTRFSLSRRVWLPFDATYCKQALGGRTPKIGTFPEELMDKYLAARAAVEVRPGANWLRPDLEPP